MDLQVPMDTLKKSKTNKEKFVIKCKISDKMNEKQEF